jgi:hypothetical protein
MIYKFLSTALILITILSISCNNDYDKEFDNSKRVNNKLKNEKLPSYDSLYNTIILKFKDHPLQLLKADSLFSITNEITNLIDSMIIIVEEMDATGKRTDIGQSVLVASPVGLRLTENANLVYQYCLKSVEDVTKKQYIEKLFSKYKVPLGTTQFNRVYFSNSSSIFIVMTLRGLKKDLSKATYICLTDRGMYLTK